MLKIALVACRGWGSWERRVEGSGRSLETSGRGRVVGLGVWACFGLFIWFLVFVFFVVGLFEVKKVLTLGFFFFGWGVVLGNLRGFLDF